MECGRPSAPSRAALFGSRVGKKNDCLVKLRAAKPFRLCPFVLAISFFEIKHQLLRAYNEESNDGCEEANDSDNDPAEASVHREAYAGAN